MHKAVVVGTGMMGSGIAAVFAAHGLQTTLLSRSEENAREGIRKALTLLEFLARHNILSPEAHFSAQTRLLPGTNVAQAVENCDVILEAAPEKLALKQELLAELDTAAPPSAILATTTSALSITGLIANCTHAPSRILTAHFWFPAHLVPLVELVPSPKTSTDVVASLTALLERCGKVPVVLRKDRPGQLGNRLQQAMVREAVNVVAEGICSVEDVDKAVRNSFGMRLPVYGIFEHQDMVGLELASSVVDYVSADLYNEPHAPPLFQQLIQQGHTGVSAGQGFYDWQQKSVVEVIERRDRFLAMLLRLGATTSGI